MTAAQRPGDNALTELCTERRKQIQLVRKRVEDAGLKEIRSFEDLVPLLFAHTVYKSYPQSFIDQGRWTRMLQWLDTLSVEDVKPFRQRSHSPQWSDGSTATRSPTRSPVWTSGPTPAIQPQGSWPGMSG